MIGEQKVLTKADIQEISEEVADKTVQKLFEGFGFDVSTPSGRLEAAGAMRWLLFCYRLVGFIGKYGLMGVIGIVVSYVIWRLTGWAGPPK